MSKENAIHMIEASIAHHVQEVGLLKIMMETTLDPQRKSFEALKVNEEIFILELEVILSKLTS